MSEKLYDFYDDSLKKYYGKIIEKVEMQQDDKLILYFTDKSKIQIFDNGQDCCEIRYLTCDDDMNNIIGGELLNIESIKYEESEDDEDYIHEITFVKIETDKGHITLQTHNKHNGHYGGFDLKILEIDEN